MTNNAQAELVGRLRASDPFINDPVSLRPKLRNPDGPEAAIELQRLSAEVERLRGALGWYDGVNEGTSAPNDGSSELFPNRKQLEDDPGIATFISAADKEGEFVIDDYGGFLYNPKGWAGGAYSAWALRTLADELDRRNAAWNAEALAAQALSPSVGEDHPPITTDGRRG